MNSRNDKKNKAALFILLAVILLGIVARIAFLFPPGIPDGDCAVFALMAKHIVELKEFPIYVPLAHYNGTLVSYIGAFFFLVFGVSSLSFSLAGLVFTLLWITAMLLLSSHVCSDRKCFSFVLAFVLLPPYQLLYYSMYTGGIGAETLLFGALALLWLILWMKSSRDRRDPYVFVNGCFCGIGLWLTPAIVPFLLTIATVFLLQERKGLAKTALLFISGWFIGYTPAIIYNVQYPGATFFRMSGRILELDRIVLSDPAMPQVVLQRILWRLSTIPASLLHMPYALSRLVGTLNTTVFVIAVAWLARTHIRTFFKEKRLGAMTVPIILIFWFILFYAVLVGEKAPRYMLGLCVVMPLCIGQIVSGIWQKSKTIATGLAAIMILSNAYGIVDSLRKREPIAYPRLAAFLMSKQFTCGFSDFWVSYPVTFESKEKVILSPTLFHPTFADRWPAFSAYVKSQERAVFVVDRVFYPWAEERIDLRLKALGVSCKKDFLDRFLIYNSFSRKLLPEELEISFSGRTAHFS